MLSRGIGGRDWIGGHGGRKEREKRSDSSKQMDQRRQTRIQKYRNAKIE